MDDKRTNRRLSVDKKLRVYTSIVNIPYTVQVENISTKGAFLKTAFLPGKEETITFEILTKGYSNIYRDNARVKWIKEHEIPSERGFGIEFQSELPQNIIENAAW